MNNDDINKLLTKKYITRNMRKKILNYIENNSMSINDFPKTVRPRIIEILEENPNKRKKPDTLDNGSEPATKRQKRETTDILKSMIKKDIENRRQNNFLNHFIQGYPIFDVQIISTPKRKDNSEEDSDITQEEEEEIEDNEVDEEEDEEYDPRNPEHNYLPFPISSKGKSGNLLELLGKGLEKKKKELNLESITDENEKIRIKEIYNEIKNMNDIKTPLKIKILQSHLPINVKATVIKKLEMLERSGYDNGDSKKFYDWIDSLLKIPFNKYCNMPISNNESPEKIGNFLNNFYQNLDNAIYGHKKVKQVLTETIAKWITHPTTKGHAIAIVGPPGVGKTSLVREGLAKGLNRPFCSMSLAGMHDEAYLTGFAMTYEGSQEGRISKMLKNSGVMNPIIFMDELDKVDTVRHGLSIMNKLIEITDFSQNHEFEDLYYQDVKLDLSKAIFVFSLNHLERVDPILKDRLEVIHVKGFNTKEKVKIALDYLIPGELKQLGFNTNDILFDEKIIRYIITQIDDEEGVRGIKSAINKICRKINILRFTKNNTGFDKIYNLPITVTQTMVDKIISKPDKPYLSMYM